MKTIKTPASPVIKKRSNMFEFCLIILITSFAVLAWLAKQYPYFGFDLAITKLIQQLPAFIIGDGLEVMTLFGYPFLGGALTLAIFLCLVYLKKRSEAVVFLVSTIGALLISGLFKLLIDRPRPDPLLIHQIVPSPIDPSFPSGHVLFFIGSLGYVLYLSQIYLSKTISRLLIQSLLTGLIITMGISRIYVGAHWFSDTLGAYLIGLVWLLIVIKIRQPLIDFFAKKGS